MNKEADSPNEDQEMTKADRALNDIAARARQQIWKCLEGLSQSTAGVGFRKASCSFALGSAAH